MLKNVLLLLVGFVMVACTNHKAANEFTYWVNSYKVDCIGTAPMKCMQIQKGNEIIAGEWQNFHVQIEGFDYRPGFIYKLRIKEEQLANVQSGEPSIKYSLVKILDKTVDAKLKINDIWVATEIAGKNIKWQENNGPERPPQIEIHVAENRVVGNDGCNNYNGKIVKFDEGILELGPLASTRMMCLDMTIPDKFNQALARVKKYELKDMQLLFLDDNGNKLITFKKVD